MRMKAVLLPRKVTAKPIPPFDLAMTNSIVKMNRGTFRLSNLLDENFRTGKYNDGLKNFNPDDIFSKNNSGFAGKVAEDIGTGGTDIFFFFIEWWKATLPLAIAASSYLKNLNKKTKVILSGPYLKVYAESVLKEFPFIDAVIDSEIEPAIDSICKVYPDISVATNTIRTAKRSCSGSSRTAVSNRRCLADLDQLPFPDFDPFFEKPFLSPRILPFKLSRGCRYRCFFCACLTSNKLRYLSDTAAVVKQLKKYGRRHRVRDFYFFDDALNFDNSYLEEFLDRLIESDAKIRWSAYFIPKDLNPRLLSKMRKAGCIHARWGIETADGSIAKKISKKISCSEAEKILQESSRCGIANQTSFITGFPHEPDGHSERIKSFILKNRSFLNVVNVFPFNPRIGSIAYGSPETLGIRIRKRRMKFYDDQVRFDEIGALSWEDKLEQQRLSLHSFRLFLDHIRIPNVDAQDHFRSITQKKAA